MRVEERESRRERERRRRKRRSQVVVADDKSWGSYPSEIEVSVI